MFTSEFYYAGPILLFLYLLRIIYAVSTRGRRWCKCDGEEVGQIIKFYLTRSELVLTGIYWSKQLMGPIRLVL